MNVINAGGRLLGRRAMARFQEKDLLDVARRQTGLGDFGDTSFLEPLRRLIESMEAEARLNPVGRLATRYDLTRLLVNRLQMEEDRKRNPGIAEEEIRSPIIITGLPRTGTTLLHSLLALDPANRVPLTWETMYPSPPPETATYYTESRIALADRNISWFHRLVKEFNRIHPIRARLPEECLVILSHSFLSYQFETTHRLPSYLDWLKVQDFRPAYRIHRQFLQHLQWRCPGKRWVLKAPAHMFDFEAMFWAYPDACVIMTHRDPIEVTASNASLTATLRAAFSDDVDPFEVGPECSQRWAEAIGKALRSRDQGCALAERFLDLYYVDLLTDPVSAVRKVYAHFGLPFPEELEGRIQKFLHQNPKDRFGIHHYSLEDFGLNLEEETRRYAPYRARFRL
ncbi:MAG TPA: sulfotransferase [Thermodesulfobacteriota bacterium]|nr:sulfotransferase [Thermodesulfobacteriota bacterium]